MLAVHSVKFPTVDYIFHLTWVHGEAAVSLFMALEGCRRCIRMSMDVVQELKHVWMA